MQDQAGKALGPGRYKEVVVARDFTTIGIPVGGYSYNNDSNSNNSNSTGTGTSRPFDIKTP